jgi:hypothetical protein
MIQERCNDTSKDPLKDALNNTSKDTSMITILQESLVCLLLRKGTQVRVSFDYRSRAERLQQNCTH